MKDRKPRKMGRPAKPDSEKQVKLAVGIPAALNAKLIAAAERKGITRHKAVRIAIERYTEED